MTTEGPHNGGAICWRPERGGDAAATAVATAVTTVAAATAAAAAAATADSEKSNYWNGSSPFNRVSKVVKGGSAIQLHCVGHRR